MKPVYETMVETSAGAQTGRYYVRDATTQTSINYAFTDRSTVDQLCAQLNAVWAQAVSRQGWGDT